MSAPFFFFFFFSLPHCRLPWTLSTTKEQEHPHPTRNRLKVLVARAGRIQSLLRFVLNSGNLREWIAKQRPPFLAWRKTYNVRKSCVSTSPTS
ncbi:hypothetical protein Prudu_020538 [Prunus dulcis]|uniref:Secreted protein n=1 Tax=Prunus dulcis TaxID=3755 RepID=A0A4Y1RVH9_PRUDU|nr:hypothetical protein Prudu_020538 [Prunus dulcis]